MFNPIVQGWINYYGRFLLCVIPVEHPDVIVFEDVWLLDRGAPPPA
jgi:hypothetical protein